MEALYAMYPRLYADLEFVTFETEGGEKLGDKIHRFSLPVMF